MNLLLLLLLLLLLQPACAHMRLHSDQTLQLNAENAGNQAVLGVENPATGDVNLNQKLSVDGGVSTNILREQTPLAGVSIPNDVIVTGDVSISGTVDGEDVSDLGDFTRQLETDTSANFVTSFNNQATLQSDLTALSTATANLQTSVTSNHGSTQSDLNSIMSMLSTHDSEIAADILNLLTTLSSNHASTDANLNTIITTTNNIDSNIDVTLSTRASQTSMDVVDGKIDALDADMNIVLSRVTESVATGAQLTLAQTDITTIQNAVDTEVAAILANTDVMTSTRATQTSVDTLAGNVNDVEVLSNTINNKIDVVDTEVGTILGRVTANVATASALSTAQADISAIRAVTDGGVACSCNCGIACSADSNTGPCLIPTFTFTDLDGDLVSGNVRSGVTIFGVGGSSNVVDTAPASLPSGAYIRSGSSGYADGAYHSGTMGDCGNSAGGTVSSCYVGSKYVTSTACGNDNGGYCYLTASSKSALSGSLVASNIRIGTTIFGVAGAMVPSGASTEMCNGGTQGNKLCTGTQLYDSGWYGGPAGDGNWWCRKICGALPGARCGMITGGVPHCYCYTSSTLSDTFNWAESFTCVD